MLLEARELVKSYNGRRVVDHVTFNVDHREIVGLLGTNGAGKTTSFRMTVGMVKPEHGRIYFQGQDITDLPMYKRAHRGIGYLPQESSVFQRLTVEQNLMAICETMRMSRAERRNTVDTLLEQFGLRHIRASLAKTVSGGERRRLEIARALITKPKLILLDEPFTGIDPKFVEGLRDEIHRLRDADIAILITDHNVHAALKVTDRGYVIHEGKVIASGRPAEIINDARVRDSFLGHDTFRGDEFGPRKPDEPTTT